MMFHRLHRFVVSLVSPASVLALAALVLGAGCEAETPYFHLNTEGKRPYGNRFADMKESEKKTALKPEVYRERMKDVANALEALFGTPDAPYAYPGTGLDQKKLALASGPTGKKGAVVLEDNGNVIAGRIVEENLEGYTIVNYTTGSVRSPTRGSSALSYQRGLYRQHCVHCHGINGDGAGPTAQYLKPYPRDYRKGEYKFTSTRSGAKATRHDLMRTLLEGIPGTAMPSFRLLPQDELEALVEYVVYLSIRGQVETLVTARALAGEDLSDPQVVTAVKDEDLLFVASFWQEAESHVITPDLSQRPPVDTNEKLAVSIAAGHKLFFSKAAACYTCHGVTATGDGWVPTPAWPGRREVNEDDEEYYVWVKEAQLDLWNRDKVGNGIVKDHWQERFALPGQQIRPRNLRQGIYRGGNRPVDLFRRIYGGIKGTAMPNVGPAVGASKGTLTEAQVWNLVDYVRSLPFEQDSNNGLEPATIKRNMQ